MKRIENLAAYTQEDLRKDIVKALFGENAVLDGDYVDFHYQPENDAGLVVKFMIKTRLLYLRPLSLELKMQTIRKYPRRKSNG